MVLTSLNWTIWWQHKDKLTGLPKRKSQQKPLTIADAVKQAVVTQKEEERKRDEKRNNLIIYGVPEKVEKDYQTRIKNDNDKINELFTTFNVNSNPKKIYRLGKFEAPNEGEIREPRALKVIMSDPAEIQAIMDNCKNLKGAADHMRKYSICYDMTKEERVKIKELVNSAKEKSQNTPKQDFKVRGPPWQTEIKIFLKKDKWIKTLLKKDHKIDNIDQTKNKLICLSLNADTLTNTLSEF